MSVALRNFESAEFLRDHFFSDLTAVLNAPLDQPYGIIISGGSTPLAVYRRIADERPAYNPKCHVIFADDRHVSRTSPNSNYGNAIPMFGGLGINPSAVIGVDDDGDLETAARRFDERLGRLLLNDFSIPVAYLGLGSDGHTCSLFTLADAAREDALGFAVPARAGFDRVTISRRVLMQAEKLVFLVAGEGKANTLRQLMEDPQSLPAGVAVSGHPSVEVWTDCRL